MLGAIGLFFYVGAEVALGGYMINYFLNLDLARIVRENEVMRTMAGWILSSRVTSSTDMAVVGIFVSFYWTGAMIGGFIGSYLTNIIRPSVVLLGFAIGAVLMLVISNLSLVTGYVDNDWGGVI